MPNEKITNKRHVAHLEVVRRQDRAIRIIAIVIAVLVVGLVAYGILNDTVFKTYQKVAEVNGDAIRVGEFQKITKFYRLQMISQFNRYFQFAQMFGSQDPLNDPNFGSTLQQIYGQLSTPGQMGQMAVDGMIDDRLIRQEAAKRGITVSTDEVEKSMQEGLGYYANGTPTPAPRGTPFVTPELNPTQLAIVTITPIPTEIVPTATATLDPNITPTATATLEPTAEAGPTSMPEPTATPYTLEGYNTSFDEQMKSINSSTGLSTEEYRKYNEGVLLRQKLLEDVTKDLTATQEQVWARHILVSDPTIAKSISEKAKSGEDFAKLAAEFSIDTSNKDRGGDLGWFGKGAMVAPFEEAAFALQPGEISEPVETTFGWHVIQVIGHENRPIDEQTFQQYKQQVFSDFLKKLREESDVKTYDDVWKEAEPTEPALQQ